MIDTNGGVSFDIGFEYGDETEVSNSCSLVFKEPGFEKLRFQKKYGANNTVRLHIGLQQ